jgi:hypothetical protein
VSPFDFDAWNKLYVENPREFEKKRKEVLLEAVASAPEQRRTALLRLVEALTAPSDKPPMAQAVDAFNAMMGAYGELTAALPELAKAAETTMKSEPDILALMTKFELVQPKP